MIIQDNYSTPPQSPQNLIKEFQRLPQVRQTTTGPVLLALPEGGKEVAELL